MMMRANVIHTDLNPCGGAERLAVATMQALSQMGFEIDFTVARAPDIRCIEKAFGEDAAQVLRQVRVVRMGRLPLLQKQRRAAADMAAMTVTARTAAAENEKGHSSSCSQVRQQQQQQQYYDLFVNTHGDVLPYYLPQFTRANAITYCHYPVAAEYVRDRLLPYIEHMENLGLVDPAGDREKVWGEILRHYLLMLENSLVLTNSNFSRQAIKALCGVTHEPIVVAPPVNVEEFQTPPQPVASAAAAAAMAGGARLPQRSPRDDVVLVVSRLNPSKKLENAIELASLLKERGICAGGVVIAGNLGRGDICGQEYRRRLEDMIRARGLAGYVQIKTNASLAELKALMHSSKIYFHTMPAEPFGISVAEAMSAGLIPVVPDIGGQAEFVPRKYQFRSLEEATAIIAGSLGADDKERAVISGSVRRFSASEYIRSLQGLVRELVAAPSPKQIVAQQQQRHGSAAAAAL
ncbi:MAG: glycosyltransferase [Thermoproteota archaeon]